MDKPSIIVLGAGPAGAACAIGLTRLGHRVQVVSKLRRIKTVEGITARVQQALIDAGLKCAAVVASAAVPRNVEWSGRSVQANVEALIDRESFDRALLQDLALAGVPVLERRITAIDARPQGHGVHTDEADHLDCDFLVEARGRQAPLNAGRSRGPETISLVSAWQGAPGAGATGVEAMPDGWSWMAQHPDGHAVWQFTLDAHAHSLRGRRELADFCEARYADSALAHRMFGTSRSDVTPIQARSSTSVLAHDLVGPTSLRIGDAAMAVDPLSGNGIFQALSSALQAPTVINTLLLRPERAALAMRFHRERVEHLFGRFARIGRDFYALEAGVRPHPFWSARKGWPDAQAAHASVAFCDVIIERRPVLSEGFIDEDEVVLTADQPLGVWHYSGVKLAPLVESLRRGSSLGSALEPVPVELRKGLHHFLRTLGYDEGVRSGISRPGGQTPSKQVSSESPS